MGGFTVELVVATHASCRVRSSHSPSTAESVASLARAAASAAAAAGPSGWRIASSMAAVLA